MLLAELTTADLLVLISAMTAAIVTVINAWRIDKVKSEVQGVKHELVTLNESTLGELGSETETRRIEKIPLSKRTAKETRHINTSTESDPSKE